jgi:SepF-like predicted cell division protein (DUF552 family)
MWNLQTEEDVEKALEESRQGQIVAVDASKSKPELVAMLNEKVEQMWMSSKRVSAWDKSQ